MTRGGVWGVLCWVLFSGMAQAADSKNVEKLTDVRGSIVFRTYCVLCHGELADGTGRAAKNLKPPPANLTLSTASDEYKENMIRKGGAAVGRSAFMPPWGQELTDEQIRDVVAYLRAVNVRNREAPKK